MNLAEGTALVHLQVYSISVDSTLDRPVYKPGTHYRFKIDKTKVTSLDELKKIIVDESASGFLRKQFFKVAFRYDFETTNVFLESTGDLLMALSANQQDIWELIAVRFIKVQQLMLRSRVTQEEFKDLNAKIKAKRVYRPNTSNRQTRRSINLGRLHQLFDDSSLYKEPLFEHFFDNRNARKLDLNSALNLIKQNCKLAPFYSDRLLNVFAADLMANKVDSSFFPPAEFPIPKIPNEVGQKYQEIIVPIAFLEVARKLAALLEEDV